jgi:hypothetical protein
MRRSSSHSCRRGSTGCCVRRISSVATDIWLRTCFRVRWSSSPCTGPGCVPATRRRSGNHLHVHLLPRWPETPTDVVWHAVDEWPGARRLDVAGIAELCRALHSSSAS